MQEKLSSIPLQHGKEPPTEGNAGREASVREEPVHPDEHSRARQRFQAHLIRRISSIDDTGSCTELNLDLIHGDSDCGSLDIENVRICLYYLYT